MHTTTLVRRTFLTGIVATASIPFTRSYFQRPDVKTRFNPHLTAAAESIEAAIEPSIAALREFFQKARSGVPRFTDSARGWISTGKLAWDALPFTSNTRHKDYLRKEFERHIFRASELQSAIQRCLNRFQQAIVSAESQMLVSLNADSPDLPGSRPKKQFDRSALERECQAIIRRSQAATQGAVVDGIAQLFVAEITRRVLTQVVASLSKSAGLYLVGVAAAPETLGASFVAAFVIDCLVGWIWNWYADPRGNLIKELNRQLDAIETVLLDGTDGQNGLKSEMHEYARERRRVREEAVHNLTGGS